jgi:hypothetical protein
MCLLIMVLGVDSCLRCERKKHERQLAKRHDVAVRRLVVTSTVPLAILSTPPPQKYFLREMRLRPLARSLGFTNYMVFSGFWYNKSYGNTHGTTETTLANRPTTPNFCSCHMKILPRQCSCPEKVKSADENGVRTTAAKLDLYLNEDRLRLSERIDRGSFRGLSPMAKRG